MYIQPNSDIKLLKNIPFDNSYNDTIYFNTLSEQYNYFNSFTKYNMTNQYYARINDGILKVEQPIQNLQDCNYLMFKNTSFGNKWFYAFINSVEYVNNLTTRITFEIDVMQTYFFDVALKQCYVEREHSATDEIGDNIKTEPFDINDYVYQNVEELYQNLDELVIVLAYTRNNGTFQHINRMQRYDNVIQGCDLFAFEVNQGGAEALAKVIDDNTDKLGNILDIYAVPKFCLPADTVYMSGYVSLGVNYLIPDQSVGNYVERNIVKPQKGGLWTDVKGNEFIPKNAKLYTYPYYGLEISNAMGQKVTYAFEDFGGENASFLIMGTLTNPVQLSVVPKYFKRLGGVEDKPLNNQTSITISNYPKVAFSGDAFTAWLAQNSVPILIDTFSNIGKGITTGASFGPIGSLIGGAAGSVQSVIEFTGNSFKASHSSDATYGSINNGNVLHAQKVNTFMKATRHIPNQYAKVIDDYFTMFGYTCDEVKYPNRAVREKFTYTKTRGCNMRGSCPADDIKHINKIYDNGIRFWQPTATVGDYSGTNNPIGD